MFMFKAIADLPSGHRAKHASRFSVKFYSPSGTVPCLCMYPRLKTPSPVFDLYWMAGSPSFKQTGLNLDHWNRSPPRIGVFLKAQRTSVPKGTPVLPIFGPKTRPCIPQAPFACWHASSSVRICASLGTKPSLRWFQSILINNRGYQRSTSLTWH